MSRKPTVGGSRPGKDRLRLYHEHIYWDQASLLVQLGLIDPKGLPVAGAEEAHKMLDQSRSANDLMARWRESDGKPI